VNEGWSETLERALASETPTLTLRDAVVRAREEGVARERLQEQLEALRARLRHEGREEDEDVVLEVLDFLSGWSSPHLRID
jgi:hypothetical protein